MNAKEKLKALQNSEQVCGACGQFIPKNELDEQGLFHSSKFCDVAIEEELNQELKTISMVKVSEILKANGIKSEFCMTGGNTGTIYIGEFDSEGNAEFAVGPSNYLDDVAYFGEICWGIDGLEDAFYYEGTEEDFTEENIAKAVMLFMTEKGAK